MQISILDVMAEWLKNKGLSATSIFGYNMISCKNGCCGTDVHIYNYKSTPTIEIGYFQRRRNIRTVINIDIDDPEMFDIIEKSIWMEPLSENWDCFV